MISTMYTNTRRHVQRNHGPELLRQRTADHHGINQNQQFVAVVLEYSHTREVDQPAQCIKKNAMATGESDTSSQCIVTLDNKQSLQHKRKHQDRLKPLTTITTVRTNIRSHFTCGESTTVELNTHSSKWKSKEHGSIFWQIPDRASTCAIKRTLRTLLTVQYSYLHLQEYIPTNPTCSPRCWESSKRTSSLRMARCCKKPFTSPKVPEDLYRIS